MDEKKMILKMVEDGKITAEEGAMLLKALGESKTEEKPKEEPKTTALSETVDWKASGSERRTYKQSSATSFFTDFFENVVQKIRDFDLDFNFGSYIEIEHIFQHKGFFGNKIDVSLENGSLAIQPWNEQDVRLECLAKVYRAHNQEEARQIFFRETAFYADDEELRFSSKVKSVKLQLTLHVPEKMYDKIKLYSFNGHLRAERLLSEKLTAKVVNGSILFNGGQQSKLSLETVNGKIEVNEGKAEECELKTVNGSISVSGAFADCDVETLNGAVHYIVKPLDKPQYADLKAMTGSIRVDVAKDLAVEGKLKTNVGGFSCDLTNLQLLEERKDFIQKSLTFTANQNAQNTLKLAAEANTGTITVSETK